MARYADGDARAFDLVYAQVCPRLLPYVSRKVRRRDQAEDVVQQTFMKMCEARGRYIRGASVHAWAFGIARNLLIDIARREGRMRRWFAWGDDEPPDVPDRAPSAYDHAYGMQMTDRLEAALKKLPPDQRAVFELLKVHGWTLEEVAETRGWTIAKTKTIAHRAYEALRNELGPDFGDGT